jgi:hypothetical protein
VILGKLSVIWLLKMEELLFKDENVGECYRTFQDGGLAYVVKSGFLILFTSCVLGLHPFTLVKNRKKKKKKKKKKVEKDMSSIFFFDK